MPLPSDSSKVVQVAQSLMGPAAPILASLHKKTDKWLEALCSNFLPCLLLWTMVQHVLWPSLHYPSVLLLSVPPKQSPQSQNYIRSSCPELEWTTISPPHFDMLSHISAALDYQTHSGNKGSVAFNYSWNKQIPALWKPPWSMLPLNSYNWN